MLLRPQSDRERQWGRGADAAKTSLQTSAMLCCSDAIGGRLRIRKSWFFFLQTREWWANNLVNCVSHHGTLVYAPR